MIISNILINFGDEVLWFVKILFILYAIFYLFSIIYKSNRIGGVIFISLMTILSTIWYASISIPYFTLGVMLSIYKNQEFRIFIITWAVLLCYAAIGFVSYDLNIAGHSAINAILIGILISVLSIRIWEIKIPAMLGAMSFDLYLVHNKVLKSLEYHSSEVSVWIFVFVSLAITVIFFLIRSKILKI